MLQRRQLVIHYGITTLFLLMAIIVGVVIAPVIYDGPVQAASPAATDNACTEIGKAGGRTVFRCIDDETGLVLFGNDAGFIQVVE